MKNNSTVTPIPGTGAVLTGRGGTPGTRGAIPGRGTAPMFTGWVVMGTIPGCTGMTGAATAGMRGTVAMLGKGGMGGALLFNKPAMKSKIMN